MTRWLLRINRKDRFDLIGPMGRNDVLRRIREGAVELGDEACAENGYWFSFHESEELHKQLGISWSQVRRDGDSGGTATIAEDETDEITATATTSVQEQPPAAAASIRQDLGHQPGPGSLLLDFFGRAPAWFWAVLLFWLLSVAYNLFGSTK